MFDDLLSFITDCESRVRKIEDYHFEVCVIDGNVTTKIAKITNYDFFYLLENGSPIYHFMPLSLTRKVYEYFKNRLVKEMEVELTEYIENDRDDIDYIFRRYAKLLTRYVQRLIATYNDEYSLVKESEVENADGDIETEVSEEKISLTAFSKKVVVKAFDKEKLL